MLRTSSVSGADLQQVRVEFREHHTRELMMVRHLPAHELPESFARLTELDLGAGVWAVRRAEPATAREFLATGELTLWLERLSPSEADEESVASEASEEEQLFAPRAAHPLPVMRAWHDGERGDEDEDADESPDLLFLYEEDWLQNQLVPPAWRPAIERELALVRRTRDGSTRALSLEDASSETPLSLSLDGLREALDAADFDGVVLCRGAREQPAPHTFALETASGTVLYGALNAQGGAHALGLHVWEDERALLADLLRLGTHLPDGDTWLLVSWESLSAVTLGELARGARRR